MPVGFVDSQDTGRRELSIGKYTAKTYLWMFIGLAITFAISMFTISSPAMLNFIFGNSAMCWILLLVEVVIVIALSASIRKISAGAATVLFLLYAVINGVTLSSIFIAYDIADCIFVFAVSAVVFAIMGIFGYVTKQDLSGWSKVLLFGLFGLILVAVMGLFMDFSGLSLVINLIGVAVFLAFTAYDTQKIKALYYYYQGNPTMLRKGSVIAALQLYLDFINLFLYMIRLFGGNSSRK